MTNKVKVHLPITLGQFLKVAGLVGTGGEAKYVIAEGMVKVNNETDTRRGRKLLDGDIVSLEKTALGNKTSAIAMVVVEGVVAQDNNT